MVSISDPANLYNPNAVAEQLRSEKQRDPTVRIGGGAYSGSVFSGESVAGAMRNAERNCARMLGRFNNSGV